MTTKKKDYHPITIRLHDEKWQRLTAHAIRLGRVDMRGRAIVAGLLRDAVDGHLSRLDEGGS